MALETDPYDHPNILVRREHFGGEAGGAATTEYCKFRHFQAMKLKAAHAVVTVAGTSTAHAFDVYHGTSSVGSISLGTSTAGGTASSATLDEVCASLDQVSVKSVADATGKAHIIFEYHADTDAAKTL